MSEPYLIAHLVRGQPAFDVAERLSELDEDGEEAWIIPTSGHRAYPFYTIPLNQCIDMFYMDGDINKPMIAPEGWPDHYPHSASPRPATVDLRSLGLAKPQPKIERRI